MNGLSWLLSRERCQPRNTSNFWCLLRRSATLKATSTAALLASSGRSPGVVGPFALHTVSTRQPVRSPLLLSVWTSMPDKPERRGRQMAAGKSEGCIVPLKPGNSGGGKAAERSSHFGNGIARTQSRIVDDNRTDLQNVASGCGNVAVGSRMR